MGTLEDITTVAFHYYKNIIPTHLDGDLGMRTKNVGCSTVEGYNEKHVSTQTSDFMIDAATQATTDLTTCKNNQEEPRYQISLDDFFSNVPRSIIKHLVKAAPRMLYELDASSQSCAFEGYSLLDSEKKQRKLAPQLTSVCRISWDHDVLRSGDMSLKSVRETTRVVDIAWNINSSLLAVLYASSSTVNVDTSTAAKSTEHNSIGYLVIWDVSSATRSASITWSSGNTRVKNTAAKIVQFLDHSSPFTCIVSHPFNPSLFVAGSSDGDLLLVDVTSGEKHVFFAKSTIYQEEIYGHMDAVTSLAWLFERRTPDYHSKQGRDLCLCSTGLDGRILYWKVSSKSKYPVRGYWLMRKGMSQNIDSSKKPTLLSSIGITTSAVALRFESKQSDSVFVGTTVGSVLNVPLADSAPTMPQKPSFLAMQWSLHALQALYRIPLDKREEIGRQVETAAKRNQEKAKQKNGIDLASFYSANLPAQLLFPPVFPSMFIASSVSHVGPLVDLQFNSSIDKSDENNVVVSCGSDGGISMHYFSLSQNRPMSSEVLIPPFMECKFTAATKLSKDKYLVLAVGTSDGHIYLYHVKKSPNLRPICSAVHDNANVTAITSLASEERCFNFTEYRSDESGFKQFSGSPRVKFLSSGDNSGNVAIWLLQGLNE